MYLLDFVKQEILNEKVRNFNRYEVIKNPFDTYIRTPPLCYNGLNLYTPLIVIAGNMGESISKVRKQNLMCYV